MADRDQAASEADQRVSDRDQDFADREMEASPADPALLHAYERATSGRGEGTMARMATTAVRVQVAAERHDQAWRRDEMARHRDKVAANRDREAEEIDEYAERMAGELGAESPAAKVAAVARASAAAARARAARDREEAARDRELLMAEIERSHMDEQSGAYGRQIGEVLLRHEIERAQGTDARLALAIVTIEETARAAEGDAAPARDALARDLFFALRAKIRPYDPIVRWDENEFACAVSAVAEEEASRSLGDVCSGVTARHIGALARVGVAALQEDDTLDSLIERARAAR